MGILCLACLAVADTDLATGVASVSPGHITGVLGPSGIILLVQAVFVDEFHRVAHQTWTDQNLRIGTKLCF